jgi:hypothetical protein
MKTCKKHIKDPVVCYSNCAGCEMERLTLERDLFKTAYNEWMDKMAWARTWDSPSELGKHIADVTKGRVDSIIAENERLREECARLKADNHALLENPEDAL